MKKNVAKILIMMLIVSTLVGCGKKNDTSETTEATTVETTTETVSEETSEVTTEVETTSTEATESETKDKTEAGTVSDKKTDSADISSDEYWTEYPMITSDGKKIYIKKTENYTFNPDDIVPNSDNVTYKDQYNSFYGLTFVNENGTISFWFLDEESLNTFKSNYSEFKDITNKDITFQACTGDLGVCYYYKVNDNQYIVALPLIYNGNTATIENTKDMFDFIIQ